MIDHSNLQFKFILDILENTDESICINSKAGTGKSTLINHWTSITKKSYIKIAPTGLAALLINGITLHSLCCIPWDVIPPNDSRLRYPEVYRFFKLAGWKKDTLRNVDVIILDEVSMTPAYILDILFALLWAYRGKGTKLPKFIFSGDAYQLAPVIKTADAKILKKHYKTNYFFSSNLFKYVNPHIIELDKVYRQTDLKFVKTLARVRMGIPTKKDINRLNRRYVTNFKDKDNDYVLGFTHRKQTERYNEKIYNSIEGDERVFLSTADGKLPKDKPAPEELKLKIGCKVKMRVNDEEKRFVNGSIGIITGFGVDTLLIRIKGIIHRVSRYTWENKIYKVTEGAETEEETIGTYKQFPCQLVYAVTIHSMQGATIDKLAINLEKVFAHSQAYVALSRVTSLEGLVLLEPVHKDCFSVDPKLKKFKKKAVSKKTMKKYFKKKFGKGWENILNDNSDMPNFNNRVGDYEIENEIPNSPITAEEDLLVDIGDKSN